MTDLTDTPATPDFWDFVLEDVERCGIAADVGLLKAASSFHPSQNRTGGLLIYSLLPPLEVGCFVLRTFSMAREGIKIALLWLTNKELAVEFQAGMTFGRGFADVLGQPVHLQTSLLDIPLCGDSVPLVIVERGGRPHHDLHRPISNIKRKGHFCGSWGSTKCIRYISDFSPPRYPDSNEFLGKT